MKQSCKDQKNPIINNRTWRVIGLAVADIVIVNISMFLSVWVYYDMQISRIPKAFVSMIVEQSLGCTCLALLIFSIFKLYSSLWEFVSLREAVNIVLATTVFSAANSILYEILGNNMPVGCYIIASFFTLIFVVMSRFIYRIIRLLIRPNYSSDKTTGRTNVMIVGAGQAAHLILHEIETSELIMSKKVVCLVDDDPLKQGRSIHGVLVEGTRQDIIELAEKHGIKEIIFAIPSASHEVRAEILNICKETNCKLKTLPGVYQLINGEVNISNVRDVEIEDLLGRDPIKVDICSIMGYVKDKVVLVTGGGGSIGSELCRQIASHNPKQLIIFDIYENNAFETRAELLHKYPELNLETLIGSVRDSKRISSIFKKYRPEIVYHAAAHKHVPLMEDSPHESIKNNVFGTLKTVQAADKYGTKKFVLISTDKAVNPTSIMGASKRICEMIVQAYNNRSKTEFVAVRFGNVLGSNGSVIPQFKKQIAEGGPVTVTHPDIIRYFMTIPEAVSLVLQAGAFAKGGEIFVLDMGKPIRILDLAKNLIRLSGYIPDVDMKIIYTGLRPGEKLYEELLMDEEGLSFTENHMIHIGKPINFDAEELFRDIEIMRQMIMDDSTDIRAMVKQIVPTYVIPENTSASD